MISYKQLTVLVALSVVEAAQNVFCKRSLSYISTNLILLVSDPTLPVGFADLVGFGANGTYIARNDGSPNPAVQYASPQFGANNGWTPDQHLRFVADATGDGTADLIGFGTPGTYIATNNGNDGFNTIVRVLDTYGSNVWTIEANPRVVVDLRNTGRVDILGFGNPGVYVSLNNGNLDFTAASLVLDQFGYNQTWRTERHLRYVQDVNGDGYPDIVGFGENNVYISTGNGDGTFQALKIVLVDEFSIGVNWTVADNPRFLADLTGDGRLDIIGFGDDGVYVSLNTGGITFGDVTKVLDTFGLNDGWSVENPRFIADINGDGLGDIIGLGNEGVYTSLNNGDGTFQPTQFVLQAFGYDDSAGAWRADQHPRFMADMSGDGLADIVGFGQDGVSVSFATLNGSQFTEPILYLADFGVAQGWTEDVDVRNPANLFL